MWVMFITCVGVAEAHPVRAELRTSAQPPIALAAAGHPGNTFPISSAGSAQFYACHGLARLPESHNAKFLPVEQGDAIGDAT